MKQIAIALVAGSLCAAAPALASQELIQEKQCVQCHAVDKDGAGPSFHNIATKWKGRTDAEKALAETILRGSEATGGPHWNKAKMPDQSERPLVSAPEAAALAKWVLAQ